MRTPWQLAALVLTACGLVGQATSPETTPGAALRARVQAALLAREPELRHDLSHWALLHPVAPADVEALLGRVTFLRAEGGVAFFFGNRVEPHGGGLLAFLLEHARRDGRRLRLSDRVAFARNARSLALGAILDDHRHQVFRPGSLHPPGLARMRFLVPTGPRSSDAVERDAYRLLQALLAHGGDLRTTWTNHAGQTLSTEQLLRDAASVYLDQPASAWTALDHGGLHLVELLLDWRARASQAGAAPFPLERLKRCLLDRDLPRPGLDDETVAHQVASLGRLVATPGLRLGEADRAEIAQWLAHTEARRFRDPERDPIRHLAHVAAGLEQLRGAAPWLVRP